MMLRRGLWVAAWLLLLPTLAVAQQTGTVTGKVVGSDGLVLPGVTVEARSPALPAPRVTVTDGGGVYRLPALQPGDYTLTYALSGMSQVTKEAVVRLQQETVVNVTMSVQGVTETVTVTAAIIPMFEKDSTALKSGVNTQTIESLPVGQQYRDLVKLIPGVQYTEDGVRGPSAGGSGQDNVYKFDGVNVTLPLFGTLSAEPSSYDIAEVTTVTGGTKAIDFNRSGGFTIDSISKSGTSQFSGAVSFQIQPASFVAAQVSPTQTYQQKQTWTTASVGGPLIPRKAFFYGSYYRPTVSRSNAANLYGTLPGYDSTRDEWFGKVTLTPVSPVLINVSWRQSHHLETGSTFGQTSSATTGSGAESRQKIGIVEASWIMSAKSYLTFKYTHFKLPTQSRPDHISSVGPSQANGTMLDVAHLDQIGELQVPTPVAGATDDYTNFVTPLIDQYGYLANGVRTGGGYVGYGTEFDQDNFARDQAQVAWNTTRGDRFRHDFHVGFQWYVDSEDLSRGSNGWGLITVPGGRLPSVSPCGNSNCAPAYYLAQYYQQGFGTVAPIHSEYRSVNFEVNDTITFGNVSINLGMLMSRDKLYGQGLAPANTLSGWVLSPGNEYEEYRIGFGKTIQPRTGLTWAYNGKDTIYAAYGRYTPAASSLPRAASWARNLAGAYNYAYFDRTGQLYGTTQFASSSGKLFVPDMTPRRTDEYLIGTNKEFSHGITGRLFYRHRYGSHYWEDTNNNARIAYNPLPGAPGVPRELYIPNLTALTAQIGSGSSYVIADLDTSYTSYHEVTTELEWRARKSFVRFSYTWTRYRGNFDQDNTSTFNDFNTFIGSSNIGDGAGRQLWDLKDGTLKGDKPVMLKLYGYYMLPWNATAGAYLVAQSGQPWEKWSYEPYIALTTSQSDTDRFAERAGSRRTPFHAQLDLNYTQSVKLVSHYMFQLVADVYNVTNSQTGYNYQPSAHSPLFGTPQSWYAPRRLQLTAKFEF